MIWAELQQRTWPIMIQGNNNTHTQQADSFDEAYNVAVGMKKEFDNAYEKWAKKRGIQVGWKKRKLQYGNKEKES